MKTKKSIFIIGLVTIAAIAAGTVIGVNLAAEKQNIPQSPMDFTLTLEDHNTTVSLKKGDTLNLTLPDFGDGGYVWTIVHNDENILHQTDSFTWGSSGLLGDFGKDTWLFTAMNTGSNVLELHCQRPFGEHETCQEYKVTIHII